MRDLYNAQRSFAQFNFFIVLFFFVTGLSAQNTFVVTTTADSGPGSLREAITSANLDAAKDMIQFNIAGTGPHRIELLTSLPSVINPVVINGTSEPDWTSGSPGRPMIIIDGGLVAPGNHGLYLRDNAHGSEINGLSIVGFEPVAEEGTGRNLNGFAIRVNTDNNIIQQNFLGLEADGETAYRNHRGIHIENASGNLVGGTESQRNVISGNLGVGLIVFGNEGTTGPNSLNNSIVGNYFGTNVQGQLAVPNASNIQVGVGAQETLVQENLISGALVNGIIIGSSTTLNTRIINNYVGTNASGTAAIPNSTGIYFTLGANRHLVENNLISGNTDYGISFQSGTPISSITIINNKIGITVDGQAALGNRVGVMTLFAEANDNIIGTATAGNIISGNETGILLATGMRNKIQGNFVGTNLAGDTAIPNNVGISIDGSNNLVGGENSGNLISGNTSIGLHLGPQAQSNEVSANLIGTNPGGTAALPNKTGLEIRGSLNMIGGTASSARNIIAGNSSMGVSIIGGAATSNRLVNNFIGTDITGTVAVANSFGVLVSGASGNFIGGPDAGNVISGNINYGIHLSSGAANNAVEGNFIGTNFQGNLSLSNLRGIFISNTSQNNTIGGSTTAVRNIISGNREDGILVLGPGNRIKGNHIGIDAAGAGLGNNIGIHFTGSSATNNIAGGNTATEANVISGNTTDGIRIDTNAAANEIAGNLVGTSPDGNTAVPNSIGVNLNDATNNLIRNNTLSGNTNYGLSLIFSINTVVTGNLVGLNHAGTSGIGNGRSGILLQEGGGNVIGGSDTSARNIISGNNNFGIWFFSSSNNTVKGNFIGSLADGVIPLPNSGFGIQVARGSNNNMIGGLFPGEANLIVHNADGGVSVDPSGGVHPVGNTISGNRIFSNPVIGIDLNNNGITQNDAGDPDSGSNLLQNFPVIVDDAVFDGSKIILTYSVPSASGNSTYPLNVEFFIGDGNRQGKEFIDVDIYKELDYSNGPNKTIELVLPSGSSFVPGNSVLGTATDGAGNTSEFGASVVVTQGCSSPTTYYVDSDGDGYGVDDTATNIEACEDPGTGYASQAGDCNDNDAGINPGATEVCDGVDNNCDGNIDEGLTTTTYYVDSDGDGYGVDDTATNIEACEDPGAGYASQAGDCNDNDAGINPGATEVCDGVDNNCDGNIDEGVTSTTYYADSDGDGYGVDDTATNIEACEDPGAGYASQAGDCNDTDAGINPGATEICDGVDNNCDGNIDEGVTSTTYYADSDGDGYGVDDASTNIESCEDPGAGYASQAGDCNDNDAGINPGATEVCDGVDNNCDGNIDEGLTTTTYYVDSDGDGYGVDDIATNIEACEDPGAGYASQAGDCNDSDAGINPGAQEIAGDNIDQDCDGQDLIIDMTYYGCTPGFWKNTDSWCEALSKDQLFFSVFEIEESDVSLRSFSNMTLQEALNANGGGFNKLARHSTAALLNACHNGVNYPFSEAEIKLAVQEAFKSGQKSMATHSGDVFEKANEAGCPLSNSNSFKNKNGKNSDVETEIQLFPNPIASEGLYVRFPSELEGQVFSAAIFDLNSRLLIKGSLKAPKGGGDQFLPIDHAEWDQGVYILVIKNDKHEWRRSIIKN